MKLKTVVGAGALVLSLAGSAFADRAPPPKPDAGVKDAGAKQPPAPAEVAPEVQPEPTVKRLADTRPRRLPDGVFIGHLDKMPGAEMRVTIVQGRVTDGVIRRGGGLESFVLHPIESGDSIEIRLQGSAGNEFVRINGAFFDAERGAGRFDGVIGREKTEGTWLLARR